MGLWTRVRLPPIPFFVVRRNVYMSLEEQKEVAINRYVDLMRIKAHETGENKELEYQIKVAKVKLSSFGIDYSELEF